MHPRLAYALAHGSPFQSLLSQGISLLRLWPHDTRPHFVYPFQSLLSQGISLLRILRAAQDAGWQTVFQSLLSQGISLLQDGSGAGIGTPNPVSIPS